MKEPLYCHHCVHYTAVTQWSGKCTLGVIKRTIFPSGLTNYAPQCKSYQPESWQRGNRCKEYCEVRAFCDKGIEIRKGGEMQIDKAIEILGSHPILLKTAKDHDYLDAVMLGIEALNHIKAGRAKGYDYFAILLPGEDR